MLGITSRRYELSCFLLFFSPRACFVISEKVDLTFLSVAYRKRFVYCIAVSHYIFS